MTDMPKIVLRSQQQRVKNSIQDDRISKQNEACFICKQPYNEIIKCSVDTKIDDETSALSKLKRKYEKDDIYITDFTVYDHCQHICKLDSDLLESNVPLYLSGRLMNDEHKTSSSRPVRDVGPINEWFVEGFMQKEESVIYIETETMQYVLLKPSKAYQRFSKELYEKVSLSTKVVEFLRENQMASYTELIEYIGRFNIPKTKNFLCEDMLIKHSQFVCDQIVNLEFALNKGNALDEGTVFISLPAVRDLIDRTGVTPQKDKTRIRKFTENKQSITATSFVQKCFDPIFKNKMCISFNDSKKDKNKSSYRPSKKIRFDKRLRNVDTHIKWTGKSISSSIKTHFSSVLIGNQAFSIGDFIMSKSGGGNKTLIIKVATIWRGDNTNIGYFHGPEYIKGRETLLGETSNPQEFFLIDICSNVLISESVQVIRVNEMKDSGLSDFGNIFYCRKKYNKHMASFVDIPTEKENKKLDVCQACVRKATEINCQIPEVSKRQIKNCDRYTTRFTLKYEDSEIESGTGIFFTTKIIKIPSTYFVGCVVTILSNDTNPNGISLLIKKMIWPSEVKRKPQHLNEVYWSEEEEIIHISQVEKLCFLVYKKNIPKNISIDRWCEINTTGIYFTTGYDRKHMKLKSVSKWGMTIGTNENTKNDKMSPEPLKTLDLFSGCGGLSYGLVKAGVADCRWAIEIDKSAAVAYQLNHKNCNVINEECNIVLQDIILGKIDRPGGTKLPIKGEVELICGGPPCQGFSGLNRYSESDYSICKNSLVMSFLSYCEYYVPKYIIMENVANFLSYKKGLMMKLTMNCLLQLGYQCSYSVMQAGNFGVPQSRRRVILLATAPGLHLPSYPDAVHIFPGKNGPSMGTTQIFNPNNYLRDSAPYQPITISDAIGDLPPIKNEVQTFRMPYNSKPLLPYQKLMRYGSSNILVDHVSKKLTPLGAMRASYIPLKEGANWRDLPNISVKLPDGSTTEVLKYNYGLKTKTKSENAVVAGVCACFIGKDCDPKDNQDNTLIPWSVVHTAANNNNWVNVYGRLNWNGFFPTTITNPDPMGKLGRVLHPKQNRVVSVRECARSQGFPDSYIFHGKLSDKYRQIGNAVAPPLALAIGLEIKKALQKNAKK